MMVHMAQRHWRRRMNSEVPYASPPDTRVAPDHAQRVSEVNALLAALRALPAKQRIVLVLRYWEDMSEQEIATALGISPGTVKSRASRALEALRKSQTDVEVPGGQS